MTARAAEQRWEEALAGARARIARELLLVDDVPRMLGAVALHAHQRTAVARIRTLLHLTNGALLADGTGLGKTFIALTVAAEVQRPLVIAPASLLDSWRRAMARARVEAPVVSTERLSRRGWHAPYNPELVIVDESHHFRNPRTKGYAAAAAVCDRAKVLLLSATPLQNRRDDLIAQLALFLGETAASLDDEQLARLIVRRRGEDMALRLPALRGPYRIELAVSNDLLDDLLAIPPSLPGSDEGDGGALVTYTLLRQWASSQAALVGWLRRRLAKAVALAASLEAGRWPSHDELATWSCVGDAVQLAIPELLTPLGDCSSAIASLLEAVRAHMVGLRQVLARLKTMVDPDPYRAKAIDAICDTHSSARVIAFSQSAETVKAFSRLLMARRGGVAELTARGARVAGGRISRREVLAQFAPPSAGLAEPPLAERISLLVTTDVLSEGLDLQAASVVIHLDLPWNPARVAQRVGRVRRLGGTHDVVFVYRIAPPASAERVLRVEERLGAKLGIASQIVGVDAPIILGEDPVRSTGLSEQTSEILAALSQWRGDAGECDRARTPLFAAVRAPRDGVLALVRSSEHRILIAATADGELTADPSAVASVVSQCNGPPLAVDDAVLAHALALIGAWCERWSSRERLAVIGAAGAKLRARIAGRIAEIVAAAPRHEHTAIANQASKARRVLALPLGAGGERRLAALADQLNPAVNWLGDIAALAEGRTTATFAHDAPAPVVVIFLRSESPTSGLASRGA
ncbi:MAG: helicase-related protein [Gemmatimonadaceae bacterium]